MPVNESRSRPAAANAAIAGPAGRAWRPSGLIKASLGLHLAALGAGLLAPATWPWGLGAVALDQVLLSVAGLWPRSRLLGPNWTRLPPDAAARGLVALTFDDGPDPVWTPWVLDQLEAHGARASFFCIGERARRQPGLCREIVARGHAVENHSLRHRIDFACSGHRGFLRELAAAQDLLTDLAGTPPGFFRAPFGFRNPLLEPALCRLDLRLASWTRRGFDTRERCPERVHRRLATGLAAGDILLLHDGRSATTRDGEPVLRQALPRLLATLDAAGLRSVALREVIA